MIHEAGQSAHVLIIDDVNVFGRDSAASGECDFFTLRCSVDALQHETVDVPLAKVNIMMTWLSLLVLPPFKLHRLQRYPRAGFSPANGCSPEHIEPA